MRDWSAARLRRASPLDALAVAAVAVVVLVVFLDEPHVLPRTSEALNLSPGMLPLYAAYSFLRMLGAYALSLGFALGAGYWASASPLGDARGEPILRLAGGLDRLGHAVGHEHERLSVSRPFRARIVPHVGQEARGGAGGPRVRYRAPATTSADGRPAFTCPRSRPSRRITPRSRTSGAP